MTTESHAAVRRGSPAAIVLVVLALAAALLLVPTRAEVADAVEATTAQRTAAFTLSGTLHVDGEVMATVAGDGVVDMRSGDRRMSLTATLAGQTRSGEVLVVDGVPYLRETGADGWTVVTDVDAATAEARAALATADLADLPDVEDLVVVQEGTTTLDGEEVRQVMVTLDGEEVQAGALEVLGALAGDRAPVVAPLLSALSLSGEATVLIGEDDLIRRVDAIGQADLGPAAAALLGVRLLSGQATLVLSDFGVPVDVRAPADATAVSALDAIARLREAHGR